MKHPSTNKVANAGIDNLNHLRGDSLTEQNLITGIGQPDYNMSLEAPQDQVTDSLIAKVNVSKVIRFRGSVRDLL